VYRPDGPPVLDRWVAPMPCLGMVEPGSYRLADGWRVDVRAGGLAVRPESMPPDPAWAAEIGPNADLILAADGPVPAAVVSALDGLVRALPVAARERLRVIPTSRHAVAAASTMEAADRIRLPEGTGRNGKAHTALRRDTTNQPTVRRRGSYGRPLPPQPKADRPQATEPGAQPRPAGNPPRARFGYTQAKHPAFRRRARLRRAASQPLHPRLPGGHDPAPRLVLPAAWASAVESPGGPLTGAVMVTAEGRVLPLLPMLAVPVKRERFGGVAAQFVVRLEQHRPATAAAPAEDLPAGGGPPADPAVAPSAAGSAPSATPPDDTTPAAVPPDRTPSGESIPDSSISDSELGSVLGLLPGRAQPRAWPAAAVHARPAAHHEPWRPAAQPTGQATRSPAREGSWPADEAPAGRPGASSPQPGVEWAAQAGLPAGASLAGQAGATGRPGTPPAGRPAAQFAGQPGAQRAGQPSVKLAGRADTPRARPPAAAHTAFQAQPQPEAVARRIIEVPADVRSTAQQRGGMRARLGPRYDVAARAVARLLSERPGLRTGDRDRTALLTELAVVRMFAEDPGGEYDPDFFVCLACGLRRLPTARAVVLRGLPAGTDLPADTTLRLRAPILAAPVLPVRQVGPVEALIWTTTGRRLDGLLDDVADDDTEDTDDNDHEDGENQEASSVVLSGHTKLRVLGVENGRFLLAEAGTPREAALNRLRAAAASRGTADTPRYRQASTRWFGALPA
jgi:hypothetical protein